MIYSGFYLYKNLRINQVFDVYFTWNLFLMQIDCDIRNLICDIFSKLFLIFLFVLYIGSLRTEITKDHLPEMPIGLSSMQQQRQLDQNFNIFRLNYWFDQWFYTSSILKIDIRKNLETLQIISVGGLVLWVVFISRRS